MVEIQRGDTEQITVYADADLTGHTCYLSVGKPNKPVLTVDNEQMTMTVADGKSTLVFTLTQEQTLKLKAGGQKLQLRAINGDVSVGWPLVDVNVLPVINPTVIVDEY